MWRMGLSREDGCNYETIKMAILYHLEITPEMYRLAFQACKACEERHPLILMQLLRDMLNKWVPLNCYYCDGVIDQVLLQQFM